jgi:hypothetical protein
MGKYSNIGKITATKNASAGKRLLIYGSEGVGKSSLAADAPNPIFLDIEEGTNQLMVRRVKDDEGRSPKKLEDVHEALDALITQPHEYKTLVIDTLDALEGVIFEYVCRRSGEYKNIEDFGYGKGHSRALDEWRAFVTDYIDQLRIKRGMDIIYLGHVFTKTFKNPEAEDYDRYQLRLHDKTAGYLKERSDMVAFAQFEGGVKKEKKSGDRARGVLTGARFLYFTKTAAYDAKSRYAIPPRLPLNWSALSEALEKATPDDVKNLREQIAPLLARVTDKALHVKLTEKVVACGDDAIRLSKALDYLRGLVGDDDSSTPETQTETKETANAS